MLLGQSGRRSEELGIQEDEAELFVDEDDDDGDDNDGGVLIGTETQDYIAAAIKEPIRLDALTGEQVRAIQNFPGDLAAYPKFNFN